MVAVSRDGGKQRTPGRFPADITGVSAIDYPTDRRYLAATTTPAPAPFRQQGDVSVAEMLVSSDGGHLWRPDRLPITPAALQAVTCPTPSVCYSVGTATGAWTIRVPGDAIPGSGLTSISCTNPGTCIAGGPAGVLATTDGARWRMRYETPAPGYGDQESPTLPGQLQLFACRSASTCVGVFTNANGGGVGVRRSVNRGRTWEPEPSAPDLSAATLTCPAITECLLGGTASHGPALLETFDTARQGQPAALPTLGTNDASRAPPEYGAVTCPTPAHCLALGAGAVGGRAISHSQPAWQSTAVPRAHEQRSPRPAAAREPCATTGCGPR